MTDEAVDRALDLAQQLLLDTARALEEAARKLRDYETGSQRLVAALEAAEVDRNREQRDRNWWAANNSRERARLEAENRRLREALEQIADGWAQRTPGVNPDGSVSTSSMAETIARAALAGSGDE